MQAGETSTITGIISNAAMMDDKSKTEGFFFSVIVRHKDHVRTPINL